MNPVNADQLVDIVCGRLIIGKGASSFNGVSIDSRTIQPENAFFAIAGEKFDGHDYLATAIEKGATCLIV